MVEIKRFFVSTLILVQGKRRRGRPIPDGKTRSRNSLALAGG